MEAISKENIILIDFLRKNFTKLSKNNIKSLLKDGKVLVNNNIQTKYNYLVKINDRVSIRNTKIKSNIYNRDINIIYEDKDIIVVNKPYGLLTIGNNKEKEHTLYHLVSNYVKETNKNNKIFIIHRLDKDTSGLVIFAKSKNIQDLFQNNWNKNIISRNYYAVVKGKLDKKNGILKSYLKENSEHNVYVTNSKEGKEAITIYNVIKENNNYSLLDINIKTGRKNQIRVQLSNINHGVIGDKKYGVKKSKIGRMALHAYKLVLIDPRNNKKISFKTNMPTSFNKLFL